MMKKEDVVKGYVAFSPNGKMLNQRWSGGAQTGHPVYFLTDDIEKATILDSKDGFKHLCSWYNKTYKNQVEFSIEEVIFTRTIELKKTENTEGKKVLYV